MSTTTTAMKVCTKCGVGKPATREFFYADHGRLRADCKVCHATAVCGRQREHHESFAAYQRRYARSNAALKAAASRTWRAANPERQAANNAAWRAANPDHEREMKRAYREANRERVRVLGRQTANTRRARKRGLVVKPADYAEILTEFGMACHLCGAPIETTDELHFDHVIPLARGGSHTKDNIRPSHALCNQRKGPRLVAHVSHRQLSVNPV